jgi:glycosyltransferase involved in cell wall biosynthesis
VENEMEKMEKVNILEVSDCLGLGGADKNLQIFAKYLDKNLFNISVCTLVSGGPRAWAIRKMGIEIHNVKQSPERFARLVKEKKIHIVHFHGKENPTFIKAAKKAGALVIALMDAEGRIVDPDANKLIDRHLVSKMCALRYKKLFRVSNEEFRKSCMIVYNPIDLDEYPKMPRNEILQKRAELGIGKNDLVIGKVGRPDIRKWSNVLIDMMPHLIERVPNVKFLIMGIPEPKKKEIERRKLSKYFVYLKTSPSDRSVAEFYQLIDILAHSSPIGESFGRTIAEAMACRRPIVVDSTPLADNAQIELVDNGKTGFVVYSPKSFAEAIAYLASNRRMRRKMGLAGYTKVKREWEARKIVKKAEKRFLELLQAKGMPIPKEVLNRYKKVRYNTKREIEDFEVEYTLRLKNCFGKPDLIRILVGKHIVFSPLMQKFVRSFGLTDFRNTIIKLREMRR